MSFKKRKEGNPEKKEQEQYNKALGANEKYKQKQAEHV